MMGYKGWRIPEGNVVEVKDASGVVLWAVQNDEPIILEVEKKTATTYAGETSYSNEEFILLDVYPKKYNSVINVTYGGFTKTLTFSGTNAQQVYFGKFNGVSDSVETPTSGTLTIDGGCIGFACGEYQNGSKSTNISYCACITSISDWGSVTMIPQNAFDNGVSSNSVPAISDLPSTLTSIGDRAFYNCSNITVGNLPFGLTSVGDSAFWECTKQTSVSIPSSVKNIGVNPWVRNSKILNNFITVDSSNPYYKIDGNCLIEVGTNTVVAGYADAIIPSYVTTIGEDAFRGNLGLNSMQITNGVKTIKTNAFYNCKNLYNITLPMSITKIETSAFGAVTGYLKTVTILATTPPQGSSSMFAKNSSTFSITVPKGCGEAYKTAEGWSTYADYIVEAS